VEKLMFVDAVLLDHLAQSADGDSDLFYLRFIFEINCP